MATVTADGLTVGYAAMLEQFHPTEVVALSVHAEAARVLRRHGGRPLPAVGAGAGAGGVRLERADRARRAHDGRHRPRRHRADVPLAPRDGRAGVGDARRDVPGPALAGSGLGRGAQRAHRRQLLARGARADQPHVRGHRHHQEAVRGVARGQGRQARRAVLQARVHAAVDHARGRPGDPRRDRRPGHRQARGPARRRADHGRRAAGEDLRAVRQVRRGRPRGRQGPRRRCRRCCSCTCRGPRPTSRPSRTR